MGGGSGDTSTSQSSSEPESESESQESSDAGNSPAEEDASGQGTFSIAMCERINIEDYDTQYLTQKLESEMNVDVEFMMFSTDANEAKTKFSLMVNGGEKLPDILIFATGVDFSKIETEEYARAGVIVPLNDYLADSSIAPNYNYLLENFSEEMETYVLPEITSFDGKIYSLFNSSKEEWNLVPYRMFINHAWLDTLSLDIPTTTDEFEEVLSAFASQDPNGNGEADEIPYTGTAEGYGRGVYGLMSSFVFTNAFMNNDGLALSEDGTTVVAPFVSDGWRKGLEYMHGLCEKGLLDPALFTMDDNTLKSLTGQTPTIVGCVSSGGISVWPGNWNDPNYAEYSLLKPLTGPDGLAYAPYQVFEPCSTFYITKDCADVEGAVRIGDWFLDEKNSLTLRYGEEGVYWSEDEADVSNRNSWAKEFGYDCKLALLKDDVANGPNNQVWDGGPRFISEATYWGSDESIKPGTVLQDTVKYYLDAHPDKLLPPLYYNGEEMDSISGIITDVTTYVKSQMAAFITGNLSMDEWDNYVAELDNMGLQTWLDIAQTVYERQTE